MSLDRRGFLGACLALMVGPLAARAIRAEGGALSSELRAALERSGFVYVSPLRRDGAESRCHGEVWFGFFDGRIVCTCTTDTWKARSVAQGIDRARVWVGDFGRWQKGRNEAFRGGPSFEARAEASRDPALVDRLLSSYEKKYPEEFPEWRDRMRSGHASGERVLIVYTPIAS